MMRKVDVIVIGGGPAGLKAAATTAHFGLDSVLIDEQPSPGGQIYRAVESVDDRRAGILGADYLAGRALVEEFRASGAAHVAGATVWRIDRDGSVAFSRNGEAQRLAAKRIILATGAIERPCPVPGWTLPGVITAGAAQILLKQSGLIARRAVIVGGGPLAYLVASQLAAADAAPLALVDTARRGDLVAALPQLPKALPGWRTLVKGIGLLSAIRRAGIAHHKAAGKIRIEGRESVTGVRFTAGGREHHINCDTVLLHQGVIPNIQASQALRLDHDWDAAQQCFRPRVDLYGRTSLTNIYIAGDGAGIGGAGAAAVRGELAGAHVAMAEGVLEEAGFIRLVGLLRRKLSREMAPRAFLDRAFRPAPEMMAPGDDVVICRCEEVTAGDIRGYARLGCAGPNQAKAFGRCGMGPCQGRYCGPTVNAVLSEANGASPAATGYFRLRMPLKPVTLGELASLDDGATDLG